MEADIDLLRAAWDRWDAIDPRPDLRPAVAGLTEQAFPAPGASVAQRSHIPACRPALKSLTLPALRALRTTLRNDGPNSDVRAWAGALLIACEMRRSTLQKRLALGTRNREELQEKLSLLAIFFGEFFEKTRDARFVNGALKLLDHRCAMSLAAARRGAARRPAQNRALLTLSAHVLIEHSLREIGSAEFRSSVCLNCADKIMTLRESPRPLRSPRGHVIIFSPNAYSLYTLAVTRLLIESGVKVDAVVIRRLLSLRRLLTEFRRDGARLLKKIWRKLVLKRMAYVPKAYPTLLDLLQRLGVGDKSVATLAGAHDIPVVYCSNLNDANVHRALERFTPDLVVFSGGGIIREETLARAGRGVVNCHMGQLPQYRGMDVVEWPLLENHPEAVGFSVHFMDAGIDTGAILGIGLVGNTHAQTVFEYRQKFEPLMALGLADCVTAVLNGELEGKKQQPADGKQYFMVHPRLYRLLDERFEQGSRQDHQAPHLP